MEKWEKVKGYEKYSVSNMGNVRNDKTGRILKPHISTCGYHQIMMGRKTVPQYVHRLVAIAFIDNPENKCEVDHIDGNKLNNTQNNLRWVTKSENRMAYGYEQCNLHRQKPIVAKHRDGRVLEFESRTKAAEYFECDKSKIKYGHEFIYGNKAGWIFELKI